MEKMLCWVMVEVKNTLELLDYWVLSRNPGRVSFPVKASHVHGRLQVRGRQYPLLENYPLFLSQ